MTEKITNLRERIVEAARRWYRGGGNAGVDLAALVQELEAELDQQSCEDAP